MIHPVLISIIAFLVTFGGIAQYFSTIPKGKVPERPILLVASLVAGILIALYSIVVGIPGSVLAVVTILVFSVLSIMMGSFILWLLTQRKTPIGDIKVKVNDNVLPFAATTSEGNQFTIDELKGKRVLLKFFRGGWCPYCSAELRMFNDMRGDLENFGIQIIALSGDTVEEAHTHKDRDKLNFTILSDPDLNVIRQYGVEHHKALGGDTKDVAFSIAGIPISTKFKFKAMSIPTSILIDENGVIRWIDQSEDYRLRASKDAVLGAVEQAFGSSQ